MPFQLQPGHGCLWRPGSYTTNGLNQYTHIAGQPLGYDANANLINDGSTVYTYDMENRLAATSGTVASSFTYDPLGRLHEVTISGNTTRFLYDGDALVAEYNSAGTLTRRYVHGDQVDEPWVQYNGANLNLERRYLHADHQGSIIGHSNYMGSAFNRLTYDAYGIPGSANTDRFGYTGQIWFKELGLFHYKARMYHPKLGRFLQTDPIFYADQMNMYAYVGNDPVNRTDPKGLYSCSTSGNRKTCEGTSAETSQMKSEMKGYKIDGATSGFLSPEGKGKIDATFSFAKENNKDINFGKSYKVKDLGGDTKGLVMIPGISKMVLDDRYLQKLNMNQMVDLLNTVIHEGLHRTYSLFENMRMGMDHPEIYEEADRRTNLQRNDFEKFIESKF